MRASSRMRSSSSSRVTIGTSLCSGSRSLSTPVLKLVTDATKGAILTRVRIVRYVGKRGTEREPGPLVFTPAGACWRGRFLRDANFDDCSLLDRTSVPNHDMHLKRQKGKDVFLWKNNTNGTLSESQRKRITALFRGNQF